LTIATSKKDIDAMRRVGRIVGLTIQEMKRNLEAGMTAAELDQIGEAFMNKLGARSAPRLVYDFPGGTCISINEETVHTVPGDRVIHPGDLVTLDVTAELDGYIADSAITVAMPPASRAARELAQCAETALRKALQVARAGQPINRIGRTVETHVRRCGFAIIPNLSGHGLGKTIHEDPVVPNFYHRRLRQPLQEGLVIAIEPIISAGGKGVVTEADDWTVSASDGSLTAHFEHTVIITKGRPIIVTQT